MHINAINSIKASKNLKTNSKEYDVVNYVNNNLNLLLLGGHK